MIESKIKPISKKLCNWLVFVARVSQHIEEYVLPQYGDEGEDEANEYTADECVKHMQRYLARFNRGQRGKEEQMRDLFKVAHYAQLTYNKLQNEVANEKAR